MRIAGINALCSLTELVLPLVPFRVPCGVTGFPSPADDYAQERLDLNKRLIKHPAATYLMYAEGDSMKDAGILHGDLLIVDRALDAVKDRIIVASLNGELIVKRYYEDKRLKRVFLLSDNPKYPPFEILPDMDFSVWGVVSYSVRLHEPL